MKNFDKSKRNRSDRPKRSDWSQKRDFGDHRGSRPTMHQAICGECGNKCEVPFKPTGERPVLCSACFEKSGKANSGAKNYSRPSFDKKQMFEAVCDKCGQKCEVPFRPTGNKPIYCSQCFDRGGRTSAKAPDQFNQQFEILNSKLDNILKILTPVVSLPKPKAEKVVKAKKDKVSKASAKTSPKKVKAKK